MCVRWLNPGEALGVYITESLIFFFFVCGPTVSIKPLDHCSSYRPDQTDCCPQSQREETGAGLSQSRWRQIPHLYSLTSFFRSVQNLLSHLASSWSSNQPFFFFFPTDHEDKCQDLIKSLCLQEFLWDIRKCRGSGSFFFFDKVGVGIYMDLLIFKMMLFKHITVPCLQRVISGAEGYICMYHCWCEI